MHLVFLSGNHSFGKLNDAMEHQNNMENNQNMSSYHVRTNSKRFFVFKLEAGNLVILIEATF